MFFQSKTREKFPEVLHDFAKEVLKHQPENVNQFAANYFAAKAGQAPDANSAPKEAVRVFNLLELIC